MRSHIAFRWTVAAAVIAALLASAGAFRADAQSEYMRGDGMPYDAFDRLPATDLEVSGGTIRVAFAPGDIALPKEKVLDWVRMSAKAVTTYYGRFPVNSLRLLLVPVDGARIRGGTTWGYRGAAIRIPLGRDSTEDVLRRDWVMVHEMVHTALPDLARSPCLAVGGAGGLCRTDRAGAGRRSPAARNLAGDDARHAEGPAGGRRPGARQYRHLGPQILGRRDVLPARRHRNSQGHPQPPRPAGRDARRARRRRQSRAGLADRARARRPPTRPSASTC